MKNNCKLLLFLSVLFATACVAEQVQEQIEKPFRAQMEEFDPHVKTHLGDRNSVVWSYWDRISIFKGSSRADQYTVYDHCAGSPNGEFYLSEEYYNSDFYSGNELHTNVAVYPYSPDYACYGPGLTDDGNSYMVSGVYFSNWQFYAYNSFPEDSFIMMAVTDGKEDRNLKFKNVCGALKLSLRGTGSIQSLTLHGNLNEPIEGIAQIYGEYDGVPTHQFVEYNYDYSSITLDCSEGVTLNEYEPTVFIMTVPPVYFENGFSVTINDTMGGSETLTTFNPQEIRRSSILVMPEVEVSLSCPAQVTIAESFNSSEIVTISGTVTATSSRGVILSDETANVLVYYGTSFLDRYQVGDMISVTGSISLYNNAYEFLPQTTQWNGYTDVQYGEAVTIDPDYIDRAKETVFSKNILSCDYAQVEGYLINEKYVRLAGSNELVYIYNITEDVYATTQASLYKKVIMKGYTFILTSSVYLNMLPSSIEVIGNEGQDLTEALGEYGTQFTGTVAATSARGYILDDGNMSHFIYCGALYHGLYNIGDMVTATGIKEPFQYGKEIFQMYDEYISFNENFTFPEPEILTAEALDNYMGETVGKKPYKDSVIPTKFIKATGTLSITGATTIFVYIDGTENNINLFTPDERVMRAASDLNGQKVDLTGYIFKTANENSISVLTSTLELSQSE